MSPIEQAPSASPVNAPPDVILIVPGLDVARPGEAMERLAKAIDRYLTTRRVDIRGHRISTRLGEGVSQATVEIDLGELTPHRVELRELAWADLRPSLKSMSIYERVWKGFILTRYWIGSWALKSIPRTSRTMRFWILLTVASLAVWYLTAAVAAIHLIWTEVSDALRKAGDKASETSPIWKLVWLAVIGALGLNVVTSSIDLSWSSYAFMRDVKDVRRQLRMRLHGLIARIGEEGRPIGRLVVLAHSFGTAVAADAIAASDGLPLPEFEFVTLGSPLEFLLCRDPAVKAMVEACLSAPRLRHWTDYFCVADTFCSKVPLPEETHGKFSAHELDLGFSVLDAVTARTTHSAYFGHPAILDDLLSLPPLPAAGTVPATSEAVHAAAA